MTRDDVAQFLLWTFDVCLSQIFLLANAFAEYGRIVTVVLQPENPIRTLRKFEMSVRSRTTNSNYHN